jgi:hypothetical protein
MGVSLISTANLVLWTWPHLFSLPTTPCLPAPAPTHRASLTFAIGAGRGENGARGRKSFTEILVEKARRHRVPYVLPVRLRCIPELPSSPLGLRTWFGKRIAWPAAQSPNSPRSLVRQPEGSRNEARGQGRSHAPSGGLSRAASGRGMRWYV